MPIKVCDAIMGSGKTCAAINYMNAHPDQKFIYITPYLDEVRRIRNACPELHFREPSGKIAEYDFRKFKHTESLIAAGENIASTHNLFLRYTDDMVEAIRKHSYTLIVDEAVDVFRSSSLATADIQLLRDAGWITEKEGYLDIQPSFNYTGRLAAKVLALAKGNRLVGVKDCDSSSICYYWEFSREILFAFKEVIVLTYLFDSQTMKYYLDTSQTSFEKIGVVIDENGEYQFGEAGRYLPDYVGRLSSMIHVLDNRKLNAVGDNAHALSVTWFKNSGGNADKIDTLRKHMRNFFINLNKDFSAPDRMWSTFECATKYFRDKGYFRSDLAFNAKATNDYRNKRVLAYCVNIFMNPNEKVYLVNSGIEVHEDEYALSVMLQWIWRSAIRDGKEIWLYVPSKRMRTLLLDWMGGLENRYHQMEERKYA